MWVLILATFGALLVSLISKFLAEGLLTDRIPIFGDLVGLEVVRNAGVAFGITFHPLLQVFLIAAALLLVLTLALHQSPSTSSGSGTGQAYRSRQLVLRNISFGLILGGALANILDRFDDGLVTDFIQVGFWPTFNLADSCITVGVALLLLFEVWGKRRHIPVQ